MVSIVSSAKEKDGKTRINDMTPFRLLILTLVSSIARICSSKNLLKRVEKHFGDADDPNLSRGLVNTVLQNCEKYYEKVEDRILTVSRDVYDGDVLAEWTRADVSGAFRK